MTPQPETIEPNLIPLDLEVSQETLGLEIGDEPKTNNQNVVNTTNITKIYNNGNIVPAGGGSIVKGFLKSANFSPLEAGWAINGDTGDAEFNGNVIAGSYTQVFRQASIPTSLHINDIWIDTDDSNKMYVALSVGADQIAAGEWVLSSAEAAWSTLTDDDGHKPADDADVTGTELGAGNVEVIAQKFTAGESLTADKFVCFKLGTKTDSIDDNGDSEVNDDDPDTNLGTAENMMVGYENKGGVEGNNYYHEAFIKFENIPSNIQSATLKIYIYQIYRNDPYNGGASFDIDLVVKGLDADFTESTITWNNKPAASTTAGTEIINGSSYNWVSIDVSDYFVALQRSGGTFYGFKLMATSHPGHWFRMYSEEYASEANQPRIEFVLEGTDGKVYLADRDAYETSRFVIGKTIEAADAEDPVTVQVSGIMDNLSFNTDGIGYPAMLTDAGAAGMTSIPRIIDYTKRNVELGTILSTSTIIFNPKFNDELLISTDTATFSGTNEGLGVYHWDATVYPPVLARKAIIDYTASNGRGSTAGQLILIKDSANVLSQTDANYEGSSAAVSFSGDWKNVINKIDLLASNCNSSTPTATIYYYG
jgi:hypothetical protein